MSLATTSNPLPVRRLECARCGTTFDCGSGGRSGGCWCEDEPTRLPVPDAAGEDCLCPTCLRAATSQSIGSTA